MALPRAPTAERVGIVLEEHEPAARAVSASNRQTWYAGMAAWDPAALLDVAGAASENRTIRRFTVDFHQLNLDTLPE
jgi:hypothetical protein